MKTLIAGHLTKADEKALLHETICGLPEGYFRDILEDAALEIERTIDSDFGFIPMRLRREQAEAHRHDMIEQCSKLDKIRAEIRDKERTAATLTQAVDKLRETIRGYARL